MILSGFFSGPQRESWAAYCDLDSFMFLSLILLAFITITTTIYSYGYGDRLLCFAKLHLETWNNWTGREAEPLITTLTQALYLICHLSPWSGDRLLGYSKFHLENHITNEESRITFRETHACLYLQCCNLSPRSGDILLGYSKPHLENHRNNRGSWRHGLMHVFVSADWCKLSLRFQ